MSKDTPKSLSELITGNAGTLGSLAAQAKLREDLAGFLRKNLPPELTEGFLHCSLEGEHTLIVVAANPEWASRLRFEANRFIELCAAQGTKVAAIKVRVATS